MFFFFYCYGHPRDLHSFPTRRSSDLSKPPMPTIAYERGLHELGDGLYAYLQPDGGWGWSNAGLITAEGTSLLVDTLFRSEEHTSELQSRFDLVCRLLLEKKKKNKTNT